MNRNLLIATSILLLPACKPKPLASVEVISVTSSGEFLNAGSGMSWSAGDGNEYLTVTARVAYSRCEDDPMSVFNESDPVLANSKDKDAKPDPKAAKFAAYTWKFASLVAADGKKIPAVGEVTEHGERPGPCIDCLSFNMSPCGAVKGPVAPSEQTVIFAVPKGTDLSAWRFQYRDGAAPLKSKS